ncbi:TetR/AcrR family transcriptional regulator [Labedaea rhizosphaerae]|uniref:TetR family transcriptional regulator n=1 Tax=Labedaea rhizosphaerae TaxID=598644 RepID=A0A4R6SES2_LABRH|nr:TetR/AcrR family transcriptional regulator [Labedaea rhizosphaerae]TDP97556.1 TetR family transcriptional regulator [Labedaea rhizosphaerae]
MSPRSYNSAKRKQGAEETKDRIVSSARALLAGRNPQLSLDAVAKHADVSRQTVYNAFGGKRGLLEALCDHLAGRGGLHRLGEAFTSKDPLGELVATFAAFWKHDLVATRRLRAFAALDDDLRAVIADRDQRRRLAISEVLRRAGMTADDRLTTLLWTLTSFETYDTVAGERGHDEAVAVLRDAAVALAGIGTGE